MKNKLISFVLILILMLTSMCMPIYAVTQSDLEDQKSDLNTKINDTKNQQDGVKEELSEQRKEIQKLDQSITEMEEQITSLNMEIAELENSIDEEQEKLEQKTSATVQLVRLFAIFDVGTVLQEELARATHLFRCAIVIAVRIEQQLEIGCHHMRRSIASGVDAVRRAQVVAQVMRAATLPLLIASTCFPTFRHRFLLILQHGITEREPEGRPSTKDRSRGA